VALASKALEALGDFMAALTPEDRGKVKPEEVKPLPRKGATTFESARKNYTPSSTTTARAEGGPECPECGDTMVKRSSIYGEFWGCMNYPTCQAKRNLDGSAQKRRTP